MLFLLCQIGDGRYSIDAKRVLEVLPFLNLMPVPQALPGLAGLFTYRGKPVPVVDLSCLLLGRPAQARLSTRLVLTRCDEDSQACLPDRQAEEGVAGFIAERATGTFRCEPAEFIPANVPGRGQAWLGPIRTDSHGFIQWLDVGKLWARMSAEAAVGGLNREEKCL